MSIIILCSFIVHVCRVCSRSGRSGRSRVWYGRWNRTWTVYFYFYYFDYIILDYNENTMYNMPQRSRPLTNTAVSIFFLKSLTGRTRGGGGGVWRRVGGRRDGTSWIYDEFRAVRSSCSRPLSRLRWRQRMMGGPVSRAVANDCYYHYYTICTQSTNRGAVTILNTRESLRRLRARVPRGGSRRFVFTFPTLWPSCTTRTAHSRCCCHRAPFPSSCRVLLVVVVFVVAVVDRCFDQKTGPQPIHADHRRRLPRVFGRVVPTVSKSVVLI